MIHLQRYFTLIALCFVFAAIGCPAAPGPVAPPPAPNPNAATPNNATAPEDTIELKQVQLVLNWFPEAEHGGFYAALVHGYYQEAGLDVEIVPGGPGVKASLQVATKRRTFGIDNADKILMAASQEAETVALMSPMQVSPRCIMVHESSGIKKFEDLKDITLAMGTTQSFSLFMQKKLPLTNIRVVPYKGALARFLTDEKFAQQAYVFSEPYIAKKEGAKPFNLMVSDLGFDPYTSVLITHPDTVKEDAMMVGAFVQASVRGWQTYLESPEETNKHIEKQNTEMDQDILAFGAAELKPLCITEEVPVEKMGSMTIERWQILADQLVEVEAIDAGSVDVKKIIDTQFLKAE